MASARHVRLAAATVAAVVAAATLGACTSDPPGPQAAADALADALESGDFIDVDFVVPSDATEATRVRTATFEGLGDRTPSVTVSSVAVDPDDDEAATATIAYAWDMDASDEDWTYRVDARLSRDDDDWRTTWDQSLLAPELKDGEVVAVVRERAPRAQVLGAGGEVIVEDRKVWRIGIDKAHVAAAAQAAAARSLATALGLDVDQYVARVAGAGSKAFVEAIVVRDGDPEYDVAKLSKLPGVAPISATLPLAPTRKFARPVLGTVGEATAETIEKSDGAIAAGDLTGLSGLQRQYDAQLRGRPGLTVEAVSADGAKRRELYSVEPQPGTPLRTTIDPSLQESAENILSDVAPASGIVAIQPSTGKILAVASGPGGDGMSTATLGQYAPGSTFKVVSALALLRAGMDPSSTVTCSPDIAVDGRTFRNFPDYPAAHLGAVDLRTAFANSCNTAFISQRDTATQDALIDAAGSLGLVPGAGLGFAAFLGAVPADSDGTDHAATMIGQGRVIASPLGMATVAASVAHGSTVTPHLVEQEDEAPAPTGTPTATPTPTETPRALVPLEADEADELRGLMRAVVTDGGAGFLRDIDGGDVIAKTGTAQFGPEDDLRNHVWMIAAQDDLAVAVFVDEGDYGSTTAGPLLEDFLDVVAAQAPTS